MASFIQGKLNKLGHTFVTLTPAAPWKKPREAEFHAPFCIYLPKKRYWFSFPLLLPGILHLLHPIAWINYKLIKCKIKKINPDRILNHGDNHIAAIVTRCGNELGIPVTTIYHTAYWIYLKNEIKWLWLRNFLLRCQDTNSAYIYSNSDNVIMLSQWFKAEYFKRIPRVNESKITYLPNVVIELNNADDSQKDDFLTKAKEILPILGKYPIITCVGRVEKVKNLQFMVEVMESYEQICHQSNANKHYPTPHVVFIGSGPYQKTIEKLAKSKGVDQLFHFIGSRDNLWTCRFLRWATEVLCAPSLSETDGLTPKEARINGCPALVPENTSLAQNSPNPRDILPLDPIIWAEAIRNFVTDRSWRDSMGHSLSIQAQKINDHQTYINKLLDIIG